MTRSGTVRVTMSFARFRNICSNAYAARTLWPVSGEMNLRCSSSSSADRGGPRRHRSEAPGGRLSRTLTDQRPRNTICRGASASPSIQRTAEIVPRCSRMPTSRCIGQKHPAGITISSTRTISMSTVSRDSPSRISCASALDHRRGMVEVHYQPRDQSANPDRTHLGSRGTWSGGGIRSGARCCRANSSALPRRWVSSARIGRLVLEHGLCRPGQALVRSRVSGPQIRLAINLSAQQFADSRLLEDLDSVLRETGCDPNSLEFEITESVVMTDPEKGACNCSSRSEHLWHHHRDRRFWHGTLLARLPQAIPGRQRQNRSRVHP